MSDEDSKKCVGKASRATYFRRRARLVAESQNPNLASSDSDPDDLTFNTDEDEGECPVAPKQRRILSPIPGNMDISQQADTSVNEEDSSRSSQLSDQSALSSHLDEQSAASHQSPDASSSPESLPFSGETGPHASPPRDLNDDQAGPGDNFRDIIEPNDSDDMDDPDVEFENHAMEDDFEQNELDGHDRGLPGYDPPLYDGAPLTLAQSLLAILTYSIVHNLTGVALADLLSLIALHCVARNNVCRTTLYRFKKYFETMNSPLKYHYYCSHCLGRLPSKDAVCPRGGCHGSEVHYFLEVSIINQLSNMYKRDQFYRDLNWRFQRVKKHENNYEDIYDGKIYRDMVRGGFLSNQSSISFMWNTDGVRVFKSSKLELWPVYLAINELPYSKRFQKENMIVAGLWFGSSKPSPGLFLSSFHSELTELYDGVNFFVPGIHEPVNVRATVLCGTCDTPAKSHFLNIIGHNGYYGCPKCLNRGERSERTDLNHAYPYDLDAPLRSDEQTVEHAQLAERSNVPIYGIKGFSALRLFVQNYISSTAVDIMHCAWQGVAKTLMELWFDDKYRGCVFSLHEFAPNVSDVLSNITPPAFVCRMPRSITEHLSYWKASEFKLWLFYYSIPVLSTIMNQEYLDHHLLLIYGLYILNSESVSEILITECEACLKEYVIKFQTLYGLKFMSINFHLLLHLADNVRYFGPLWVTSCMPYEDLNGRLVRLVHGTRYAALQITSGLTQLVSLPILLAKLPPNDEVRRWCEMLQSRVQMNVNEQVSPSISTVGKYVHLQFVPPLISDALNDAGVQIGNVTQFFKLKKGKYLYFSESYGRSLKTSSVAVEYIQNNEKCCGIINTFIRVSQCNCVVVCRCEALYFAVITALQYKCPFQTVHPIVSLSFLRESARTNVVHAIPVQDLLSLCFRVSVGGKTYVIPPMNSVEFE